jgi:hypothetical protein
MPEYVLRRLGDRENFVCGHGFADSQIGSTWWNRSLELAGLGQFEVSVDPNGHGSERLTRTELFELARTLKTGSLDEDTVGAPAEADEAWMATYLRFLWHVLAWGSGTSRRHNGERIEAFASADARMRNVKLLRNAAHHARDRQNPRDAYSCLIRKGGGKIPGLGPAFFTKFLYFVGAGDPAHSCLILDSRVAESLFLAGWDTLPRYERDGKWNYSYNWHTDTYVGYCDLLRQWAVGAGTRLGYEVSPDEIERALFDGPLNS